MAFQIPEALRDVLHGISDYVKHADCKWQVECVDGHDFNIALAKQIVDGAITGLGPRSRKVITRLRKSDFPVVNVLRDLHPQLPSVLSDNRAIGVMGANYLRQRGFRQFGYVGVDTPWSKLRQAGFMETLRGAGFPSPFALRHLGIADFEYASKVRARNMLRRWVKELPKGTAVMCAADFIARTLLGACEEESVGVPDEMAILGVDNFLAVCELASVPLSSIAQDFEGMGREAAALLDQLMQKKEAIPRKAVLLPPGRLHVRKSSDILAFEDPVIVSALQIIHDRAASGISMKELLAKMPLSRKWLDYRFKQVVGHTPSEEIRRCRLQSVCELLIDTEMPLRQIAARGRFSCVQNLIRCFRFAYGVSPQAYRLKSRGLPIVKQKSAG